MIKYGAFSLFRVSLAPNLARKKVITMKNEMTYGIFLLCIVLLMLFFSGCVSNNNPAQPVVNPVETLATVSALATPVQVLSTEIPTANVTVNATVPVNAIVPLNVTPEITPAAPVVSIDKKNLLIVTTDSFAGTVDELQKAFAAQNPDVLVTVITVPERKILDNITLLKKSDIIIGFEPNTGSKLTGENIINKTDIITGDSVVLAWDGTKNSVEPLNANDWYYSLFKKGVKLVILNPQNDQLGAEALSAVHLSDRYYGLSQIFPTLIGRESQILKTMSANIYTINVTFPFSTGTKLIFASSRPDAVAFIKNGSARYGILSRSVAEQNGLTYLSLPPEIDLSSPSLSKIYNTVAIRYFAGTKGKETVQPMEYEFSFPVEHEITEQATNFGNFVMAENGQGILKSLGYNSTSSST